jgi:hypothetical protein
MAPVLEQWPKPAVPFRDANHCDLGLHFVLLLDEKSLSLLVLLNKHIIFKYLAEAAATRAGRRGN